MEVMTAGPPLGSARQNSMARSVWGVIVAAIAAAALLIVSALPAWAIESPITMVWVRHGQSVANEQNILNSVVPGPTLTCCGPGTGRQQAIDVVPILNALTTFDRVYASDMVRTQQTSQPFRDDHGNLLPYKILPGIREISSGIFEGSNQSIGGAATALFALPWMFGLLDARVPGRDQYGNIINGKEFNDRTSAAVAQIWLETVGEPNATAAVFSHFGTIAFWTMMNAENADPLLLITQPIGNTNYVEVVGSPEDGWNVTNWNGTEVDPDNPTISSRIFVTLRSAGQAVYGLFHPSQGDSTAAVLDQRVSGEADDVSAAIDAAPEPEQPAASADDADAELLSLDSADLTDAKAKTGKSLPNATVRGQRVLSAVQDVRDQVDSSLKAVGDVVRAVTGTKRGADKDADTDTDTAGSAERDAA